MAGGSTCLRCHHIGWGGSRSALWGGACGSYPEATRRGVATGQGGDAGAAVVAGKRMRRPPADGTRDVRELLGMHTRTALALVAFYALTIAVLAYTFRDGIEPYWPVALAVGGVASLGALSLVTVPGDPLPLATTVALACIGPGTSAMVFAVLPVPPMAHHWQTWPLSAATAIYTFMCVRGRTLAAWVGFLLMIGVCIVWAAATGQGGLHGLAISVINFAPLLMSTFFALTIRPMLAQSSNCASDPCTMPQPKLPPTP